MEFWIFIEAYDDFSKGINIIYDKHISVSIYADPKDKTNLKVICLPQAYRDVVFGLQGDAIQQLAIKSLNSANDNLLNKYQQFIFIRCAFNLDNEIYYLNTNGSNQVIKKDFTYKDIPNITPYKNFSLPKAVDVYVQNAGLNSKVRIYMRTLNIYREFIPRNIDLSRRKMSDFIGPTFWPLIFTVDFKEYDAANFGLTYRFYDPEQSLNLTKFITTFLIGFKGVIYTSYPNYKDLVLCDFKNEYIGTTCTGNLIIYI